MVVAEHCSGSCRPPSCSPAHLLTCSLALLTSSHCSAQAVIDATILPHLALVVVVPLLHHYDLRLQAAAVIRTHDSGRGERHFHALGFDYLGGSTKSQITLSSMGFERAHTVRWSGRAFVNLNRARLAYRPGINSVPVGQPPLVGSAGPSEISPRGERRTMSWARHFK